MSDATNFTRLDWAGTLRTYRLVWGPPIAAIVVGMFPDVGVRTVICTIALGWMGTALAPALVYAAIEGRLPRGMGVARLCDLPAEWSRQHQFLGLTSQ